MARFYDKIHIRHWLMAMPIHRTVLVGKDGSRRGRAEPAPGSLEAEVRQAEPQSLAVKFWRSAGSQRRRRTNAAAEGGEQTRVPNEEPVPAQLGHVNDRGVAALRDAVEIPFGEQERRLAGHGLIVDAAFWSFTTARCGISAGAIPGRTCPGCNRSGSARRGKAR